MHKVLYRRAQPEAPSSVPITNGPLGSPSPFVNRLPLELWLMIGEMVSYVLPFLAMTCAPIRLISQATARDPGVPEESLPNIAIL